MQAIIAQIRRELSQPNVSFLSSTPVWLGSMNLSNISKVTGVSKRDVMAAVDASMRRRARLSSAGGRRRNYPDASWTLTGKELAANLGARIDAFVFSRASDKAKYVAAAHVDVFACDESLAPSLRVDGTLAAELDQHDGYDDDPRLMLSALDGVTLYRDTNRYYIVRLRLRVHEQTLANALATLDHGRSPALPDGYRIMSITVNGVSTLELGVQRVRMRFGEATTAVNLQLAVTNGQPPYTLAIIDGLAPPPGVTVNFASFVVAGVPTQAGAFSLMLKVTDAARRFQTVRINFLVELAPPHDGDWFDVGDRLKINYVGTGFSVCVITAVNRSTASATPYTTRALARDEYEDRVNVDGVDVKLYKRRADVYSKRARE